MKDLPKTAMISPLALSGFGAKPMAKLDRGRLFSTEQDPKANDELMIVQLTSGSKRAGYVLRVLQKENGSC